MNEHFSETFDEARNAFRGLVRRIQGAQLVELPLAPQPHGVWGGEALERSAAEELASLSIDVAIVRGEGAPAASGPALLHFSGVHGVEGHAGSAVQCAILARIASEEWAVPAGTTLIAVHLVNPFGFKHGRRFNENNVDLNRNLIVDGVWGAGVDFETFRTAHPTRDSYDDFSPLLNRTSWRAGFDDLRFFAQAAWLVARHGMVAIKRAIVSGQYHNPKGIFFGGHGLEASHAALLEFLQSRCAHYGPVVHVDVHTGLGPSGVDTLLLEDDGSEEVAAWCRQTWGDPEEKGYIMGDPNDAGNASAGYDQTAGFSSAYICLMHRRGHWSRALSVTQEFGTVPGVMVVRGLSRENVAFARGPAGTDVASARRALRDVFYVPTDAWRTSVVGRGLAVAEGALEALAAGPGNGRLDVPANRSFVLKGLGGRTARRDAGSAVADSRI